MKLLELNNGDYILTVYGLWLLVKNMQTFCLFVGGIVLSALQRQVP